MRKYKFGVVVFPGTNCDQDVFHVLKNVLKQDVRYIFHRERDISQVDCIVLPGGFSYGDYLRTGAIARFSPIMESVKHFAKHGGLVMGICNGFQILTESGLLPGAFLYNSSTQFRCGWEYIRVESDRTPFSHKLGKKQVLRIPIAHGEGNYYCDSTTLKSLTRDKQIVFRYCDNRGRITKEANPNGSIENIAGIINKDKNVLGIMPHPERCSEEILGGMGGLAIWQSIISFLSSGGEDI